MAWKAAKAKMPTSLAGQNKRARRTRAQSGFTLIEVMVVMLIIGLMVGAVALSLPARPNPLSVEGKAMASTFRAFAQSSMVDRKAKGIRLTKTGYELMAYQDGDWLLVQEVEYKLDAAPTVRLLRNGAKINLEVARKIEGPMVRFDSTGLATPFTLEVEDGAVTVTITGNVSGEITYAIEPEQ